MIRNILTFMLVVCSMGIPAVAGFDMLPTKDGTCRFFYATDKNTQGWYIETSSDDMCENGVVNTQGQITIYNAFGNPVEQIYGFFNGGYWTGDKELFAQVISGYAENAHVYKVSFELPSDSEFDIRYLSQMVSQKQKNTSFGPFSFCNPFRILVQTKDYGLFQDESLTNQIIDDTARYAKVLCPSEHKIQLFGSSEERPSANDVFFYADIDLKTAQIDVKRNDAGAFSKKQNETVDMLDKKDVVPQNNIVKSDFISNTDVSYSETLEVDMSKVPLTNEKDVSDAKMGIMQLADKIPHLLTLSRLTDRPVQGTVIVEIKRVSGRTAEADTPCKLKMTGDNLVSGWAIVSGDFSYQSGRKGAELTGKVEISSVIQCEQAYCTDVK